MQQVFIKLTLIVSTCAVVGGAHALAAELRLGDAPYTYTVIDQDVRSTLREFGANLNVRVMMSDAVQGRIRGRLPPLPPGVFLDRIATMYGLDWYYDGYAISVTAHSEGTTQVLSTPGLPFPELKTGLTRMGIWDNRYVVRPQGEGTSLMLVAGPPHFVQLVQQTASLLVSQAAGRTPPPAQAPTAAAPVANPPGMTVFRAVQEQKLTFGKP